jgi:ligand-binding sensor domain-containing protein/signal transduction histidine kinase/CheY-like chemotaxis protein
MIASHHKKMKFLLSYNKTIILFCLLVSFSSKAQHFSGFKTILPNQNEYIIDSWNTEKGLPVNGVNVLAQTHDGYLWLGTEEGLIRYNGSDFVVFNSKTTPAFKDSFITSLYCGFGDTLWIGTRTGKLIKYFNQKFTDYTIPGLNNKQINTIIADNTGIVWIGGAETGLIKFDGKKAKVYTIQQGLIDNHIKCLFPDSNGGIWIGTINGLSLFKSERFSNFTVTNGLAVNYIRSICSSPDGKSVWIGTNGGGITIAKTIQATKKIILAPFELNLKLPNGSISSLISDKESVWIGMYGGGVSCYHPQNHRLSFLNSKNGLTSDLILNVFKDKEKNIWIGAFAGGIFKLKKKSIYMLDKKSGLESEVILPVLCDSKGDIWIGTEEKGLYQYTKGKVKHFGKAKGLSNDIILSLAEGDNGIIWAGTSGGGLNKVEGDRITVIKDPLKQRKIVSAILNDPGKGVWVGTDGGGLNYLRSSKLQAAFQKPELQTQKIFCLLKQHERFWIGTDGNGLQYIENGIHYSISEKTGLKVRTILALLPDADGGLWIATVGSGLNYLRNGKVTVINSKHGLFDDNIMQLLPDKLGYLWMGSNNGIAKVSLKELKDFVNGTVYSIHSIVYGVSEGMNTKECNGGSLPPGCITPDGILCFPTAKGLAMFDPKLMDKGHSDFMVKIEKVLVNNKETETNKPLKLNSDLNYLEIHYAAITFADPNKINYQYKLQGFDKEWQAVGNRRVAYFTNLASGRYVFKVRACGSDGEWIESKDVFQFSIPLPFYRSLWFYFGVVLLLFLIVIGVVSFRVRRQKGIELTHLVEERTFELQQEIKEREKLSEALLVAKEAAEDSSELKSALLANMSHELRTPMNGILGFSEILRESLTNKNEREMADHICKSGERLMYTLNTVLDLAMLESGNLEINNRDFILNEAISNVVLPYLAFIQSKNINLELNVKEGMHICADRKIIERILGSLIDNAIKFTKEGTISILAKDFVREGKRWISISVNDTGIGIPKDKFMIIFKEFRQVSEGYGRSQEGTGLGLSLGLKMARLIGGEILLSSELNKGSSFELVFPDLPETNEDKSEKKEAMNPIVCASKIADNKQLNVLVVEDNEINVELIMNYISASFNVVVARNGYEAVNMASQQSFQIILMDINLGPGMNGIETMEEIKKINEYHNIPFIAVTGYSDLVFLENNHAKLFDEIITKPYNKKDLLNVIFRFVHKEGNSFC